MSELKNFFSDFNNEDINDGGSKKSRMPGILYFLIPLTIITGLNLFFFYVVSTSVAISINISWWLVSTVLLVLYACSKMLLMGKKRLKEKVLIISAIHSIFIVASVITLCVPVFPIYIKVFLIVWIYLKTRFLFEDLKIMWKSDKSKSHKSDGILI